MLGLFFVLSLSFFGLSDWSGLQPEDFSVSSPPADKSAIDQKDHQTLLDYQKTRTPAQCAEANQQWIPGYASFFIQDGPLTKDEAQRAQNLVSKVIKIADSASSHFKKIYMRERPYDRFSDVQPCIKKPQGNKSYPSGHATMGMSSACVLAEIFPQKANELMKYGAWIGELRVLAGVHHPTDVEAGQQLGMDICNKLKADPSFLKDIKNVRSLRVQALQSQ